MNTYKTTTLAFSVLAVVGLSYVVYFDYKRRNDPNFRRKLRKEKKKVDKSVAQSKALEESVTTASSNTSVDALREALQKIREEEAPSTTDEREQYFMSQVSVGEQLATQGPAYHLQAALSFFRALRVYPAPVELIMIYQKTVPPPIFTIVMELTNLDVSSDPTLDASSRAQDISDTAEASPTRSGPPSETSSQEWDKVIDT